MDARPKQLLLALSVVLASVLLLLLGVWLGGHPRDLPSFVRSGLVADEDTRAVGEAIDTVADNYYRPVSKSALVSASIEGMLSRLHDPYSYYLSSNAFKAFDRSPSFSGIGVEVDAAGRGLRVMRVFDSSPAQRAGLRPGDLIVSVGARPLSGLSVGASRALIVGPPGTDVHLTILHQGRRRQLTVTRETISEPVVASSLHVLHGVKLGVVYLATFSEGSASQVRAAVDRLLGAGAQGLVLDLRANGGGLVSEAQAIASIFIASGVIVTTRGRSQPTTVLRATGGAISPSVPVVVLVDRGTASAAEIVTAALQDHGRARVVGTHTYGKGVFQELEPLHGGGGLKITVGEYFTPNGRNLGGGGVSEGAGITPEVRLRSGVDTETGLAAALKVLAGEVK
jgi:carboxyl-terminal processing protease